MILLAKLWILIASVIIAYVLGYYLTEYYNIGKFKLFDFEAFKCRQCLSFHIAWVLSSSASLLLGDWVMFAVGIVFAFALFFGLKIDQKRKTISINDLND